MTKSKIQNQQGFTLVEMMVAVSIFAVVAVVASVALVNMLGVQEKTSSARAINDNLNFAMELMMREIRTGTGYSPKGGQNPDEISFASESGEAIQYRLKNELIERKAGAGGWFSITSPEVKIKKLLFVVEGENPGDGKQPRVTIMLKAETVTKKSKFTSRLNIQTTVSQREIDS